VAQQETERRAPAGAPIRHKNSPSGIRFEVTRRRRVCRNRFFEFDVIAGKDTADEQAWTEARTAAG